MSPPLLIGRPTWQVGGCLCPSGQDSICLCEDTGACPWPVWNLPGLPAIGYRVGDFASFRHAMLRQPPGETELDGWRPTAATDLALQVVDWWAYVAHVLAFYNERIANESYLGTAILPESVSRLVFLLGYRPRPGIGASATLAVLAAGPGPVVLPAGFGIASKASPGIDSQTFELPTPVTFAAPTSVAGPPPESTSPQPTGGPPDDHAAGHGGRTRAHRPARARRRAGQRQARLGPGRRPAAVAPEELVIAERSGRVRGGDRLGNGDRRLPAREHKDLAGRGDSHQLGRAGSRLPAVPPAQRQPPDHRAFQRDRGWSHPARSCWTAPRAS